jgi:hypothetical protein
LIEPRFEPELWGCVCEVDVVEVDVPWFDWVDVVVGGVPWELEVPGVEVEVEVLPGGVVLVGDEGVGVPEPLGTEGTEGVETVGGAGTDGVVTVGVVTVGVVTVGVDTSGVVTVSAEAGGSAAIPITTASAMIAPTSSFRLRDTVVNLPSRDGSRSRAPRRRASPHTASHLEA